MTPKAFSTAMVATILVACAGCSLTTAGSEMCSTNRECRATFGLGWVCGSMGFCRQATVEPRCDVIPPEPADLLSAPDDHLSTIIIGSLQDRSVTSKIGRENAVRLAVSQANDEDGLDDYELGVVFCTVEKNATFDDLDRSEAAKTAADYLIDVLGVPAIVGPSASTTTQAVFLHVRDRGVLIMSPAASGTVLTTLESTTPGLLWRTAPPDSLQGAAIAEDMIARSRDNVHIVHETGAYGEGLAAAFSSSFSALGGTATPSLFSDETQLDVAAEAAAANSTAQEILFAAQTVLMVRLMDFAVGDSRFATKSFFVTDTAANTDFLDKAKTDYFGRVRGTRPAPLNDSDPVYSTFVGSYTAEYGEDPRAFSYTAHAYDAAWLVLYGIAWAQLQESSVTGANIAAGLQKVSAGNAIEIRATSWQTVVELFRAGTSIDVRGASGSLDYDPVTEETIGPVEVWTIDAAKNMQCAAVWTQSTGLSTCP